MSAHGRLPVITGRAGPGGVRFGSYVARLPARRVPAAIVALAGRYDAERGAGEDFGAWAARQGPADLGGWLGQFEDKRTRQEAPDMYTDWGESQPFRVTLGRGECS